MNNLKKLVGAYYPMSSYPNSSIGFMGEEGLSVEWGGLFNVYKKHEALCPKCYHNVLVWSNYYEAKEYNAILTAQCMECKEYCDEKEILVGEEL